MGQENRFPFIAIIDDELDLACLFREALSQIKDVQVFAFSDPNLALEHFQTNHDQYKVVIADYRMPDLTGIELLNKMKQINPSVTRILMSAFEINDEMFDGCKCIHKFLQKPIKMLDLIKEVQLSCELIPQTRSRNIST